MPVPSIADGVRAADVPVDVPPAADAAVRPVAGVVVPVDVDVAPAGAGEPHTSHQPSS